MRLLGKARIKKGVRPYGGRIAYILGFDTQANGRKVVVIKPPADLRQLSPRDYYDDEVEIVEIFNPPRRVAHDTGLLEDDV